MVKYNTGINIFMDIAGGKWKCLILYFLSQNVVRTKEFYELIPGITQKVLTEQLKQLEKDGLVSREVFNEIPPKVEYSLTELGQSFVPVLKTMCDWGNRYAEMNGNPRDKRIQCDQG
ncbi:winged helix-turn-helix transcriptional regulator [Paenibacillus barcinonensis]|uniref:HxlR family transcriptional regulator n=1 Tax=Paenibacillus barcinonensis TaxID=198119 RepID=A0A2V4URH9_PAEBA|nr:helix-turn-helix domain-containing protein [Paenibacillus barcinonensis]PYE42787.1 HxlR family transcriptional regulator [Paenibacillus barcinonensis]QKS57157.1 winged helix-turn-helix transcriptional regulator [Paenibacillus barcinonensis]